LKQGNLHQQQLNVVNHWLFCGDIIVGNVLKEICDPAGAVVRVKDFVLGDPTLSVLELWGAEYQESNALLVREEDVQSLKEICHREKVPVVFVGNITGTCKTPYYDEHESFLPSFTMHS
jgi:phosphoribosylformylglycinamidine synthase